MDRRAQRQRIQMERGMNSGKLTAQGVLSQVGCLKCGARKHQLPVERSGARPVVSISVPRRRIFFRTPESAA